MPSPFPGMDPYLESVDVWPELHGQLIHSIRRHLHQVLPERYVARIDRHIWVHDPDEDDRILLGRPDVFVTDPQEPAGGAPASVTAAPATITLPFAPREGHRFVRIKDVQSRRVVTVIELLNPSNKASGPDREAYLAKRNEYLASRLNLVEIDLLRSGQRMPLGAPPPADYYVLIARAASLPQAGVWPIGLRQSLPTIPIPLDPDIPDVTVNLQACLSEAFEEGRLGSDIKYTQPPTPPLHEPDATWARELLAARTT
jgi:hypothetical protein